MNIMGITGLMECEKATLKALGAVENRSLQRLSLYQIRQEINSLSDCRTYKRY